MWGTLRKKQRTGVFLVIGAFLLVLLLLLGVVWHLTKPAPPPGPRPLPKPPLVQGKDCSDVELVAVPGTWESKVGDDPREPKANPHALLLSVTRPLTKKFDPQRFNAWTVSYPAQFRNPNRMQDISYDDSRAAGKRATVRAIKTVTSKCPKTNLVLVGFSQGAVIAGDIASELGRGLGPIPPERVLDVALISDGRRELGVGTTVGSQLRGKGLEIVLEGNPLGFVASQLGATMTGARPGGFGSLSTRVFQLCARGDLICDASSRANDLVKAIEGNGVHGRYGTNRAAAGGKTAPTWVVQKFTELVENAPSTHS